MPYPGAVLLVSHARDLISQVATRVIAFTPAGLVDFNGAYEEYLVSHPLPEIPGEGSGNPGSKLRDPGGRGVQLQVRVEVGNPQRDLQVRQRRLVSWIVPRLDTPAGLLSAEQLHVHAVNGNQQAVPEHARRPYIRLPSLFLRQSPVHERWH